MTDTGLEDANFTAVLTVGKVVTVLLSSRAVSSEKYVDMIVGVARMNIVNRTDETEVTYKFHSKIMFSIKQIQLYEAFCASIFLPSLYFLSRGEELK